jgi:hypothetical protein
MPEVFSVRVAARGYEVDFNGHIAGAAGSIPGLG